MLRREVCTTRELLLSALDQPEPQPQHTKLAFLVIYYLILTYFVPAPPPEQLDLLALSHLFN
uniref:Uncharacterized protein n=1 Tax=Picea glauca TaxID=3330 RepID=A0A101LWF4_PICGL|nr:hypothetical protein ABT39_MTgene1692 [Picea glauca]QHR86851.1 hypothetical protein Q903MT_gene858 [Picea sitchensis]